MTPRLAGLATLLLAAVFAAPLMAQDLGDDMVLLPYPDRIAALKAPVNAALRYGAETERRFVTDIVWGPEKAPGLFRLQATGTVRTGPGEGGPVFEMTRGATAFSFGPKRESRADAGSVKARITPLGGFGRIQLNLPNLDSRAHRRQFNVLGTGLIDRGRIPAFRRIGLRAGPDDTGGGAERSREKEARADILEALQPMLGLVLEMPAEGLHTGSRLTVLRRDLGDLFRDAGPIPLRVDGTVVGIADIDERRFLTLKLDHAELTPPMRANIKGYALIDLETALPEAVVAEIELIVVHGTDTSVFRFVERRALLPDAVPQ